MKKHIFFTLLQLTFFIAQFANLNAQTDIIELDSCSGSAVKTVPFDKPFIIKLPIEAENVNKVFLIKKYKHLTLNETIVHYIEKSKMDKVLEIEKNYFWTKKTGGKNYLFISVADKYLFKPSQAYFIIPEFRQTNNSVLSFFDLYYQSTLDDKTRAKEALLRAQDSLSVYETHMRNIYGDFLNFGFMTLADMTGDRPAFARDPSTAFVNSLEKRYELSKKTFNLGLPIRSQSLLKSFMAFDTVTYAKLLSDKHLKNDAVVYLHGNNLLKNEIKNAVNDQVEITRLNNLLSGASSLNCFRCETADSGKDRFKDLNKRLFNIDSSLRQLNILQSTLVLLRHNGNPSVSLDDELRKTDTWLREFRASRDSLNVMGKQRKKIEDVIMDSVFVGKKFTYTQVFSGNTYMSFETRNKMLLTPDFGIVTSLNPSYRKSLQYAIIPYMGFHINMMAVDKDIPFTSYRKNPLQRLSLMVGWSLVNINKNPEYENFFANSSLLTGIGIRLSNAIRLTAGKQWLFKIGTDEANNQTRSLKAISYAGISFDLNIKQYLNGFLDILSGFGKSNESDSQ
jgi:hypothetical protein